MSPIQLTLRGIVSTSTLTIVVNTKPPPSPGNQKRTLFLSFCAGVAHCKKHEKYPIVSGDAAVH